MTISGFRTWVNTIFGLNGSGGIDGNEVRDGFLEVANQIEAQASWSPVMTLVADSARIVVKIVDWTGGVGTKPTVNVYLGSSGLVTAIASAVDVRGPQGPTGSISSASFVQVTANNPTSGLFMELRNSASSSWLGTRMGFTKNTICTWRMGLPDGSVDAFVIEGWTGGTYPEWFRIASNGNVGIGINAPSAKLDVSGDIRSVDATNPALKLLLNQGDNAVVNTNFGELQFQASNGAKKYAAIRGVVGSFSDLVGLCFYTNNGSTNYAEVMRILPGGNVGIGLTAATEKLDVSGRIRTQGVVSTGSLPSITKNAGLGSSGTVAMVANSNDLAGGVTLTAAAGAAANSTLATVTFTTAYTRAPRILLTPANANASLNQTRVYAQATASGFSVYANSTGPVDLSVAMEFTYVIIAV